MIDEEILDKVCPIPDEDETMEEIKGKLGEEGFIINNFNKGGIFYIIIRIFVLIYIDIKRLARSIINNLFIKHAEGDWLEIKVADVGKKRKEAIKTRGYVTLYRDDYQNALQITKGHMFKTLPDVNGKELKFYVLDTTVIGAGEKSGKVLVEAESPGTGYNVSTGKITVSMIHLDGVVSVSNEEGWLYEEGADIEDLEDLRTRAEDAWSELAERTTDEKLINVSKKVSGVLDVRVDAQHPRGQGTTDIIITSTSGEATQELLKKVENATAYLKGNYLFRYSLAVHEPHSTGSRVDYWWRIFYWSYRKTDGHWNTDGQYMLDSSISNYPVKIGFRYKGFLNFPHESGNVKGSYTVQIEEQEEQVTKSEEYSLPTFFYEYKKTDGTWMLDGSVLMNTDRTDFKRKDAFRASVTHEESIKEVRWHNQHNLFYLDGSWLTDGSKIVDAYEHTIIIGFDLHYLDGTWTLDGKIFLDGIENQEVE